MRDHVEETEKALDAATSMARQGRTDEARVYVDIAKIHVELVREGYRLSPGPTASKPAGPPETKQGGW